MDNMNKEYENEFDESTKCDPDKLSVDEVTDDDIKRLKRTLKFFKDKIGVLENNWKITQNEFKITESQIKKVYQFNEQHRDQMPPNLTEEEQDEFDHFNGVDRMTEEDITLIFGKFGEDNPIIGVDVSQTKDRIKQALADFFYYLAALKEYNNVDIAYMRMIEMQEAQYIIKMKLEMEHAENDEVREACKKAIDNYYYYKYLKFLAEPLDEKTIKKLVEVFGDQQKLTYWMNRSRDKINQAGFNSKVILELSQFEKNYLEEKYHCISNALLLRFFYIVTFADIGNNDSGNSDRTKVLTMITTLDGLIRNIINDEETRNIIFNNIRAYLDQMLEPLKEAYPVEVAGRAIIPKE